MGLRTIGQYWASQTLEAFRINVGSQIPAMKLLIAIPFLIAALVAFVVTLLGVFAVLLAISKGDALTLGLQIVIAGFGIFISGLGVFALRFIAGKWDRRTARYEVK